MPLIWNEGSPLLFGGFLRGDDGFGDFSNPRIFVVHERGQYPGDLRVGDLPQGKGSGGSDLGTAFSSEWKEAARSQHSAQGLDGGRACNLSQGTAADDAKFIFFGGV